MRAIFAKCDVGDVLLALCLTGQEVKGADAPVIECVDLEAEFEGKNWEGSVEYTYVGDSVDLGLGIDIEGTGIFYFEGDGESSKKHVLSLF